MYAGPTQLIRSPCGPVLGGCVLGQPDDPMLGGRVGSVPDGGDRAMDRGHVDDRAAACSCLQHGGDLVAHAIKNAVQIDVDDTFPVREIDFTGERLGAADAGVVDGIMQRAVRSNGVPHNSLGVLRSGRVLLHGGRGTACAFDFLSDPLGALKVDVGQDDRDTWRASAFAIASPRPDPPPVTIATFPVQSGHVVLQLTSSAPASPAVADRWHRRDAR